jgi:hypothetical protein
MPIRTDELLNCLCAAIPARERVITCEEVFELCVALPDVTQSRCHMSLGCLATVPRW